MSGNRIIGYDFARALTLLGMLLINFWVMMENTPFDPHWLVSTLDLIQGRAAATFVLLAGVGLSLMSKSALLNNDAARMRENRYLILKRALFLFIIGMLNSLIWRADILHVYGIYFVIGMCLLIVPTRRLLLLSIIPVAVSSFFMLAVDFDRGLAFKTDTYSAFWKPTAMAWDIFFNGLYPVFPWATFLILGMWLGRQRLSDPVLRKKILFIGIGVVAFAECISRMVFHLSTSGLSVLDADALLMWFTIEPWDPMPLFMLSAGGTAVIVVSFSISIAQKWGNTKWILPFVSVGQTTLTLYVAHIIIGSIALEVMKVYEVEPFLFPIWGACAFYISALILCSYWRKSFQKGPLEWLMRSSLDIPFPLRAFRHARVKLAQPDF
ncbi:MAG: heparan-alpha-glucosaminide N-acetyltransferase domain-containing protein [Desulfobacteraceae bacterium]|jgi:uncharacterized membrane protein YeiB